MTRGSRTTRRLGAAKRTGFGAAHIFSTAKSLTLGSIDVPDEFLLPVVRGRLDGDGSVVNFVHAPTKRLYPTNGMNG